MSCHYKYDIAGFANDLGFSLSEVSELYAELIKELNSAISELKLLMAGRDLTRMQTIIHNIKGVSANYRLIDIYEETSKINDFLKSNHYNNLELDLHNLFVISNSAEKEIKNFFKQSSIFI